MCVIINIIIIKIYKIFFLKIIAVSIFINILMNFFIYKQINHKIEFVLWLTPQMPVRGIEHIVAVELLTTTRWADKSWQQSGVFLAAPGQWHQLVPPSLACTNSRLKKFARFLDYNP